MKYMKELEEIILWVLNMRGKKILRENQWIFLEGMICQNNNYLDCRFF